MTLVSILDGQCYGHRDTEVTRLGKRLCQGQHDLGGINVIPDPHDVQFLADPANPTIIMGTPLTVYRTTTATHTPLIRGGHVSPSPWGTTRSWGPSVIHFPRGKYQQHWDRIRFNDGGARFSARNHRGPGEHVRGKCCAPHKLTGYASQVECQHIFEQFRKAMGKLPKRILFYHGQ